jgi:hypothetical protein
MRHSLCLAVASALMGLLCVQPAAAQVYQCLDATGKKVFSQTPCAAGGNREKLIVPAPAPTAAVAPPDGMPVTGVPGVLYGNGGAGAAPRDWAAENAAANARANAGNTGSGSSSQSWPPLTGLRKGTTTTPASDKQIIANCEANHGARCSSAGEIAQRRMEQRELTASERQQQQSAVAARRQREQEEAFNRSLRR